MKPAFKTLKQLPILLLYCFVIVINSGSYFSAKTDFSTPSTSLYDSINPEFSHTNLFHTTQTENGFNNVNSVPGSGAKTGCEHLFGETGKDQQKRNTQFTFYQFFSENILLRLTQPDIIFPFHYFW